MTTGINPAENESMFFCVAYFPTFIGVKQTIICIIEKDYDSIWIKNHFKLQLIFNYCFCIKFGHQANISEVGIITHKHDDSKISCNRWYPFLSWDKTSSWSHKLIDSDKLTNFCWRFNFIPPGNLPGFVTTRTTVWFSIITTWKSGRIYIGDVSGDEFCFGHKFEVEKSNLANSLMNNSKYLLFFINLSNGGVSY